MNYRKVFLSLLLSIACVACKSSTEDDAKKTEIKIGALLDLSGNGKTLGEASLKTIQVAIDEANARFDSLNLKYHLSVETVDTKLDTLKAQAGLKSLYAAGARIIVGPQTSSEVRSLMSLPELANVLIVSQGSTAGTLSKPNDNVFRFCPDDSHEGEAITALMVADSITGMISFYRNDEGNGGLRAAVRGRFSIDTRVEVGSVAYPVTGANYQDNLSQLHTLVSAALQQRTPNHVAVFAPTFEEIKDILKLAAADTMLMSVRWYGADGVVFSDNLNSDEAAAAAAQRVGFPCPTFGLDEASRPIWTRVAAKAGLTNADAFSLAPYDIVSVAANTIASTSNATNIATLRAQFIVEANKYHGATGATTLNENGDRSTGSFDFYAIKGTPHKWTLVAKYTPGVSGQGTITRF